VDHPAAREIDIAGTPRYVFPEKRFENAFPGNLRFYANCFAQNT
jgi:hypothetical protein